MKFPTLVLTGLLFVAFGAVIRADSASGDSPTNLTWQPSNLTGITQEALLAHLGTNTRENLIKSAGVDNNADLAALLKTLRPDDPLTGTYILNVIKWAAPDHKETSFNNWYLYDGNSHQSAPPLGISLSEQDWLQRRSIPGRQTVILVCLEIPSDERTSPEIALFKKGTLSYAIAITKQKSQFDKDLTTIISMVYPAAASVTDNATTADTPLAGYVASYPFNTPSDVCSISIAPTNGSTDKKGAGTAGFDTVVFADESPAWRGLSFAIPVASYKDVTFDQSANTLTPKTVSRQNLYACLDIYLPPIEPSLLTKSYLPHPFVGLPITGKVLEHPMAGVALGRFGVELFYSGIYDLENKDASGAKHAVWKSTYGIKISIDAGKAALAKVAGK